MPIHCEHNMSSPDSALCIVCAEIPWRTPWGERITEQDFLHAYTRLIAIAGTRFQWADASGLPVKGDREYWPYILNNSTDCEFCQFAIDSVRYPSYQPTYHGGFKLKKKNFYGEAWQNKPVWTQLIGRLNTRPIVRLWIGDGRPEHFIRAIEPHTTFGM